MDRLTVALHWSGGKDSTLALAALLEDHGIVVDRLLTTTDPGGRSTVHEIPVELLHTQADALGIPLQTVVLPGPGLDGYVERMHEVATTMRREGVDACAFGIRAVTVVVDAAVLGAEAVGVPGRRPTPPGWPPPRSR